MTVFNYVRRGLFERDKLTVATMLTLKILVNDGILAQEEVDYLVMSKVRCDHALQWCFRRGRLSQPFRSGHFLCVNHRRCIPVLYSVSLIRT